MDGQAGVGPWRVVGLTRRGYRPSVSVVLENGTEILVIPVDASSVLANKIYKTMTGRTYYGMHAQSLEALYDLVEE